MMWRSDVAYQRPLPLHGAGLGLFSVRQRPVQGRDAERQALWKALEDVGPRPGVALLRGRAGMGKSALTWWLARRASELGAARFLDLGEGIHEVISQILLPGDPTDVLASLQLESVNREAISRGLEQGFTAGDAELFFALLETFAASRRVVLVLDPLTSSSAWWLDSYLEWMAREPSASVLLVAAASESTLQRSRGVDGLWGTAVKGGALDLEVGELANTEMDALLLDALPLDPRLLARVHAHARGVPRRALTLLEDWAEEGHLVLGPKGFLLAPEGTFARASGVRALARLEGLLLGLGPETSDALERLALLERATVQRWRATGPIPHGLLGRLVQRGVVSMDRELQWLDAEIRDAVLMGSKEDHVALHGRIADGLHDAPPEVLGPHLAGAERYDEAIVPLLDGADRLRTAGEDAEALALLEEAARCIQILDLPDTDTRVARAARRHGWVLDNRAEIELAYEFLQRAVEASRVQTDLGERVRCLHALASFERRQRRPKVAVKLLMEAEGLLGEAPEQAGFVWFELGMLYKAENKLELAEETLLEALAARPDPDGLRADVMLFLGFVAASRGTIDVAHERATEALRLYQGVGNRHGTTGALDFLGTIARIRGDFDQARSFYEQALALQHSLYIRAITRLNLGMLSSRMKDFDAAIQWFRGALLHSERADSDGLNLMCHAAMLWPLGELQDLRGFDHHLDLAKDLIHGEHLERDVAECLLRAAACVTGSRRRQTLALAQVQLHGIEDERVLALARELFG